MKDLYGLLGYPLGHSFSAKYFAEKFERERICAEYKNFEFPSVSEAMQHLCAIPNLQGFNVTIPYKQAVIPFLDTLSDEAREIGAVNVVRVEHCRDGKERFHGYNSDVTGFSNSIRPLLRHDVHRHALILGTGGASKAVVYGLRKMGVECLYVSRRPADGRVTYNALTPIVMKKYKVVVNCSPVGMFPKVGDCPAIPYDQLTEEHLLYDLVYNPLVTRFMEKGMEHGATVKSGLEMLHLQAEAAWKMWTEEL